MKRKLLLTALIACCSLFLTTIPVLAQNNSDLDLGIFTEDEDEPELSPIRLQFFPQGLFNFEEFSLLSWISALGNLLAVGLIIYWVALIIRAAFNVLQSQGEEEGLQQAYKRLQSTFIGLAIAIFFPLVLTILGIVFNVGAFWNWPKAFQRCEAPEYNFYFQALIAEGEEGVTTEINAQRAEEVCGYN